MPDLPQLRREKGLNQADAATAFRETYNRNEKKALSPSYALKRLSLIETGVSPPTDLEVAALARIYGKEEDAIRRAALERKAVVGADETSEDFFEEIDNAGDDEEFFLGSVYGGARYIEDPDDDAYGRLLINALQRKVKLAMYLPYPERSLLDTRDHRPDASRLIAAYDAARTYAHDRFEEIRQQVPKGSVALYEPNLIPFLKSEFREKMQPYIAPFNIRQTLIVRTKGEGHGRVLVSKRLFAWTHDERSSGGTIPREADAGHGLRKEMQIAWTAWMGEPLTCWEQCGRLGDTPSRLEEKRHHIEDFCMAGDENWAWQKTALSLSISKKYTNLERERQGRQAGDHEGDEG